MVWYPGHAYVFPSAAREETDSSPLAQIYPIDSAKTHYQRNCLTTAADQPIKMPRIQFNKAAMYRGLGVSMARSCLINTIFFSSFEFLKKKINALPDPVD